MSNQLQKPPANQIPTVPHDAFKYWADMAINLAHAGLAAQVMAGFALIEIRQQTAAPGKRTDLTSPHDAARLPWQEAVKQHGRISDDTARRWINMAEGLKSRFKKLNGLARLKALMEEPPSEWSELEIAFVAEHVTKATDGLTQADFMRELGIAKKAPGNHNAHGNGSRKLTTKEQRTKALEMAFEDSGLMGKWITASNRSFILTTQENDLELDAQISVLEFALKLRMKTRNTPRPKRDAAFVAELQDQIAKDSPLKA